MKKLKNNAFVGNTGHFHNEIDLASSEGLDGMKIDNIKPRGPFVCSQAPTVSRFTPCEQLPSAFTRVPLSSHVAAHTAPLLL